MPVVVPDFALLVFILSDFILEWVVGVAPGPTLPSLDAPGAGCICAEAIAVAPSIEATTRAEIASLDRMENLLLWMDDAGVKTSNWDLGSGPTAGFSDGLCHALTELGAGNCIDRHEKTAATCRVKQGPFAMPKENDLEGVQDQGGKHGGQKGMPRPETRPPHSPDQGIVRDKQGQEQPRDKERAQQADQTNTVRR
jgi:hypothetical protein